MANKTNELSPARGIILRRALVTVALIPLAAVAIVGLLYETIPQGNTGQNHFDTIIVLGHPSNPDGTPGAEQRERVLEAVREFRAGVAPNVIMTGGAAHNHYVEANTMVHLAASEGVPVAALVEEGRAQNTIQNAYFSIQIMKSRGWNSAEVVSSPSHLPRASLIFKHFPIRWKMHAAAWPASYTPLNEAEIYAAEAVYSSRLRLFGFPPRSRDWLSVSPGKGNK